MKKFCVYMKVFADNAWIPAFAGMTFFPLCHSRANGNPEKLRSYLRRNDGKAGAGMTNYDE